VGRVGLGDKAEGVAPEGELGVAEQGVIGTRDEAAGHLQDGPSGSTLDAGSEFLGLVFEFGAEGLRQDGGSCRVKKPLVTQNYTEVNKFPTNFRAAHPKTHSNLFSCCDRSRARLD
jgi:hypothetical protein